MKHACFSLRSSRRKSRDPCPEHLIAGSGCVRLAGVNVVTLKESPKGDLGLPGGAEQNLKQRNFKFTNKEYK